MAFDYAGLRDDDVAPLVRDLGVAIILKKKGTSALYTKAWDAGKGKWKWTLIAEPHTVVYTDPASVTQDAGYAIVDEYPAGMIDGTLIKQGDRRLYAVDIAEPVAGADVITVGGRDLEVVEPKPIAPGGVPVLYEVQVR